MSGQEWSHGRPSLQDHLGRDAWFPRPVPPKQAREGRYQRQPSLDSQRPMQGKILVFFLFLFSLTGQSQVKHKDLNFEDSIYI